MVALDIGGTKLAAGLVSVDGEVLCRDEQPTGGADADALFGRGRGVCSTAHSAQRSTVDTMPLRVAWVAADR